MVLGLVGGILGLVVALPATVVLAGYFNIETTLFGAAAITSAGVFLLTFLLAVAGIVGGALARTHLTASRVLLLVSGVLGFAVLHVFWLPAGICLLLAGGLLIAAKEQPKTI